MSDIAEVLAMDAQQKEIELLRDKLEAATKALEILDENSYCHHTPHMICVPTEHWKRAMNTTTGENDD